MTATAGVRSMNHQMPPVLDRIGDALTARPATVFWDALTDADEHIHRDEQQEWAALFAPPITTSAKCLCGSTFEIRDNQIRPIPEEQAAAAEAVADHLGRPLDDLAASIVARVIDAINHERATADDDARRDWECSHADCGADL